MLDERAQEFCGFSASSASSIFASSTARSTDTPPGRPSQVEHVQMLLAVLRVAVALLGRIGAVSMVEKVQP